MKKKKPNIPYPTVVRCLADLKPAVAKIKNQKLVAISNEQALIFHAESEGRRVYVVPEELMRNLVECRDCYNNIRLMFNKLSH